MFRRLHTDHTESPLPLENAFAGPVPSACWILGGGPSLGALPCDEIAASPIPKMALNLAGTRLVRPTFWTSYDPSARFHRSIYLDPGVMKFVHRRRAMDLVPETTFKVCDCPNTLFFDRDPQRGFADFLSPHHTAIVDWADTLVQAIDILYRLGFRILYLAGCEMCVRPSPAQIARAEAVGVRCEKHARLDDWRRACHKAGLADADLDALDPALQYHFDEHKPIAAAANTDFHYFRITQFLRLSRRAISLAGMQLISVTPGSRFNDHFPYSHVRRALHEIRRTVGDPSREPVRGLYRQTDSRQPPAIGPMRDYRPHNWPKQKPLPAPAENPAPRNDALPPFGREVRGVRDSSLPPFGRGGRGGRSPQPTAFHPPDAEANPDLLIEHEGFDQLIPHDLPTPNEHG